jgi:hypothetical protein
MHLVLVLATIAVVAAFLLLRAKERAAADVAPTAAGPWGEKAPAAPGLPAVHGRHALAFVSRGKLFCSTPSRSLHEIQSSYSQAAKDRIERSRRLHGWKEGTAFSTPFARRRGAEAPAMAELQVTSAQFTPDGGCVLYFLRDSSVGGLFSYDVASGAETRLLHRQQLFLDDLALGPDGGLLLGTQHARNGTANIVQMKADGSDYRELTGGDTIDSSPAWIPNRAGAIVFESAGLARNEAGMPLAAGPSSIQMLETGDGTLTTVLEHPRCDFLRPRVGPDGALYYIRRPYEPPRYGPGAMLADAVMFPFRLLRALFHYLNFFSLMYTRKPLTSASGPELEADVKEILLRGKRIDAEAALRSGATVGGVPSLVPASWQLVRRGTDGEERVLGRHVVSFDIAPDGTVLFTNGYGVFELDDAGTPRVLMRDKLVGNLVVGVAP